MSRPNRADFLRRVVTHGNNEVHLWRTGAGKFVPALASCFPDWHVCQFQLLQRFWPNLACWMTTGIVREEVRLALWLRMASAMIDRAELPVHENSTLYIRRVL
jgi:hypothetical protein